VRAPVLGAANRPRFVVVVLTSFRYRAAVGDTLKRQHVPHERVSHWVQKGIRAVVERVGGANQTEALRNDAGPEVGKGYTLLSHGHTLEPAGRFTALPGSRKIYLRQRRCGSVGIEQTASPRPKIPFHDDPIRE